MRFGCYACLRFTPVTADDTLAGWSELGVVTMPRCITIRLLLEIPSERIAKIDSGLVSETNRDKQNVS